MFASNDSDRQFFYCFNRYGVSLSNIYDCVFSRNNPRNGVHRHRFYEACVVTEGSGYFVCGNATYVVAQNCLFIAPPNTEHEIICGEGGLLKLWFYTFSVSSAPSGGEKRTEPDRIIDEFFRRHGTVAGHCGFLTSYAEFCRTYALRNGTYGLKPAALTMLLDSMQLLCMRTVRENDVHSPLMYKITSYISENIQSNIAPEEISRYAHISQRSLYLLFKRHLNTTPARYINAERINASIGYLNMGFPIKTVAELMNFSELSSFSRLFKKVTGRSPSSYLSGGSGEGPA